MQRSANRCAGVFPLGRQSSDRDRMALPLEALSVVVTCPVLYSLRARVLGRASAPRLDSFLYGLLLDSMRQCGHGDRRRVLQGHPHELN